MRSPSSPIFALAGDRQLFVTYKGLATTGYYTDWNHITQNFFIANYESSQSVDNECVPLPSIRCAPMSCSLCPLLHPSSDGTAYYNTSLNLMMYGGDGMKSASPSLCVVVCQRILSAPPFLSVR